MIERVSINGIFGVSAEAEGLKKFNVFFGPNGCGKTVIAKAIAASVDREPFPRAGSSLDFLGKLIYPNVRRDGNTAHISNDGWEWTVTGRLPHPERTAFVGGASALEEIRPSVARRIVYSGALTKQIWEQDILDGIEDVFPGLVEEVEIDDDSFVEDDESAFRVVVKGKRRFADDLGEGFLAAFNAVAILTAIKQTAFKGPALAVFDCVDAHMDETTKARALQAIARIAAGFEVQVVWTTRSSSSAMNAMRVILESGVLAREDVAVFTAQKDGATIEAHCVAI